jgi:hypothetical protein
MHVWPDQLQSENQTVWFRELGVVFEMDQNAAERRSNWQEDLQAFRLMGMQLIKAL